MTGLLELGSQPTMMSMIDVAHPVLIIAALYFAWTLLIEFTALSSEPEPDRKEQ